MEKMFQVWEGKLSSSHLKSLIWSPRGLCISGFEKFLILGKNIYIYNTTIEPFNFSFFSINGWSIDLYYCDVEWLPWEWTEINSVSFEIIPKHCISDSFVDYEGDFISSKGFLPTVVDGTLIWIKFAHKDLQDLLEITSKKDLLFIRGDWNPKVASHEIPWVTGKFDLGVKNETGKRLTDFCQENTLVIANTLF